MCDCVYDVRTYVLVWSCVRACVCACTRTFVCVRVSNAGRVRVRVMTVSNRSSTEWQRRRPAAPPVRTALVATAADLESGHTAVREPANTGETLPLTAPSGQC